MAVTNKNRILNIVFIEQQNVTSYGFFPSRSIRLYATNTVVGSYEIGKNPTGSVTNVGFTSTGAGIINLSGSILFSGIPQGTVITHVGVIVGNDEILKTPIENKTYNFEGTYTLESYQISM